MRQMEAMEDKPMKRTAKPVFFIVALLIFALTYTAFFGVYTHYGDRRDTIIRGAADIRFGIDIRGGVDVTFAPEDETIDVTPEQMNAVKDVIIQRLIRNNITDHEAYADVTNKQVIVRFPWKSDEADFDTSAAIEELGKTASLEFYLDRQGTSLPTKKPSAENLVLTGKDVEKAAAAYEQDTTNNTNNPVVSLELKTSAEDGEKSGKEKFDEATKLQKERNASKASTEDPYSISIWLDDECISNPKVEVHITDGKASITGMADYAEAVSLSNLINSGALPFGIKVTNSGIIAPSMGEKALDLMVLAGVIAFVLISVFMILYYRLPGVIAVISLMGQIAGSIAVVSGYFGFLNSFTLTLPGIAGIILSIGMGVDANVITAERIKDGIRMGKTIDGAVSSGCHESFSAIFDGNITVIIVAIVLMGVFGPPSSFWSTILYPFLFMFPVSTSGAVYSFGFTLFAGIIFNFVIGVTATRLMIRSATRFRFLRKPWLLGGKRNEKTV